MNIIKQKNVIKLIFLISCINVVIQNIIWDSFITFLLFCGLNIFRYAKAKKMVLFLNTQN